MKIDLVYTWVNGSDPAWLAKRAQYQNEQIDPNALAKGRFFDNDELKYSLRSVERFAPWINHIYIVTDHQVPSWLNTSHMSLTVVDHREIIPERYLPIFNSSVIEWFERKIRGLSEFYLCANDDMFFGKPAVPENFFDANGNPIEYAMKFHLSNSSYSHRIKNTYDVFTAKTGQPATFISGHVIDAYRKSYVEETVSAFNDELEKIYVNRFRANNDILRYLISYYDVYKNRRKIILGNKNFIAKMFRPFRVIHLSNRFEKNLKGLKYGKYLLFGMNDVPEATDERRKKAHEFLENYFSKKSSFEKNLK